MRRFEHYAHLIRSLEETEDFIGRLHDCCAFCCWGDDFMLEKEAHECSPSNGISLIENRIRTGKMVNIIAAALGKRISTDYLTVYRKISYYNEHLDECLEILSMSIVSCTGSYGGMKLIH